MNIKRCRRSAQILGPGERPLKVDIQLLAKLPRAAGTSVIRSGMACQEQHERFEFAYDEASALRVGVDQDFEDFSATYSFAVSERGIPFHRHVGPRLITAVSGCAGCCIQLSFCSASNASSPEIFAKHMISVLVPESVLFVLKLPGEVFHRFESLEDAHPALFGVSVHPDETCGLSDREVEAVKAGLGTISTLTIPLDDQVARKALDANRRGDVPAVYLTW